MKINEIEANIKQGDCSETTIESFRTALKRVPQKGRCQHCYTAAASMPLHCYQQAISLIEYGLSEHCICWVDRMRSFHNMATIYETVGDYQAALKNYSQALFSIDDTKRSSYTPEYAAHMMRMEMHISNFEYTENLHRFYDISIQAAAFSQSFQKKLFYRSLAEIIILSKCGDIEGAEEAYCFAIQMLKPGYTGPLTALLKRKNYIETAGITKEAEEFLQRVKQYF